MGFCCMGGAFRPLVAWKLLLGKFTSQGNGGGCLQNTKCIRSKIRMLFDLQHQFMLIKMFKMVVIEDAYRYGVEVRTQC